AGKSATGETRDVARQHVDLEIDAIPNFCRAERGVDQRMRDEVDAEAIALNLVDGERDAVERDRAFGRDRLGEGLGHAEGEALGIALAPSLDDFGDRVDVARNDMAAELVA